MASFIGFSTKEVNQRQNLDRPGVDGGIGNIVNKPRITKKFRLVDEQLVIRDLLNAFSIRKGDKVGQPNYGTTLWTYLYEPNTPELRDDIETELRRVIGQDPRIVLNDISVYFNDHGILLEIQMYVEPINQEIQFGFFMNREEGTIQRVE